MWIKYKEDAEIGGDFERFSVFLLLCPECGHVELDVIGTYELTRKALTEVEGMIRDMRLAIQSGEFPKKCSERKYPYCRVCTPQESGAFRCQEFDICDVDDVTFGDIDEDWE